MDMIQSVVAAHRCGVPLVGVKTPDPAATIREISEALNEDPQIAWEIIGGYRSLNEQGAVAVGMTKKCDGNIVEAIKGAKGVPENTVVFVQMADRFLTMPQVIQAIWNLRDEYKSKGQMLILIGANMNLPPELAHDVLVLDEPLPNDEQLGEIVKLTAESAEIEVSDDMVNETVNAIAGLTSFEAEQVVAMSIINRKLETSECWERKRKMIDATKGLSVFRGKDRFDDLAGLGQVKKYLRGLMSGEDKPRAIVWLDEIEKSGLANTGDLSGVNSDQLGVVLSYMEDRKVMGMMLVGVPGCQPAGSKVLMADGTWKNVEDVRIGDLVVSPQHDGTCVHARVLATAKYDNEPIYRVSNERGQEYYCSGDHVIPHVTIRHESLAEAVSHGRSHSSRRQVHELVERTASEVFHYPSHKQSKLRIFTTQAVEFDANDPDVNPYLLGVLIGDGCMTHGNYRITNPDREIKESLEQMGVQFGKERRNSSGCPTYGLVDESQLHMRAYAQSVGLNCRSERKFIPEECKRASLSFRLELLAGLIDTDGTDREFSSASCELAEDFAYLVRSVGGIASVRARITHCNGKPFQSWRVQFSFAELRPNIRLERKRQPERDMKWKNPRNCHASIELTSSRETVYGFTLDSDSSWYVTDDWIVTHNSGKSHLCKAMAAEFDRIVIRMDMGAMKGSLVGDSEQNIRNALKIVDAIAGDNAMFVATSNSIEGLDTALRSRFTGTFFFDLPTREQREQMWEIHMKAYGLDGDLPDHTGWSGRNVQRCCYEAKSHRIPIVEASNYIIPELLSNREAIERMRAAATGKYLSSCFPGAYMGPANETTNGVRKQRAFG